MQNGKLPNALPLSVLSIEGATYYWFYINRLRFADWCACGVLGDKTPWQPPTGWTVLRTLYLKENLTEVNVNLNNVDYPIAVVLKQGEMARRKTCYKYAVAVKAAGDTDDRSYELCRGGHITVIIRGTGTGYEGNLGEMLHCDDLHFPLGS